MFEKFDGPARAAVLMAKDIADSFNQDHISTSHILLSIVGYTAETTKWKTPPGVSPKVAAAIAALGTTPEAIIDQTVPGLDRGIGATHGHLPFTPNLKRALEFALRSSMMLGDNHIGPEHLFAGLTRAVDSTAGTVLARLGINDTKVYAAIRDSTPAPSPTAARTCDVYLPVGKCIFKNGGKVYPDLASAQAAHPDQEIAPFAFPLNEGEFFDVCTLFPRQSSWGKFASYRDAFAAAEELRQADAAQVQICILTPEVTDLSGMDSRGHDVVLGRNVRHISTRLMARVLQAQEEAATPSEEEGAHV